MAEIDLEELKRMVAMRDGADDKWAVAADKALHASAPVLARRVLELAAEVERLKEKPAISPKLTDLTWPDGRPKIAPVQGYLQGIPWSLHLKAYDVYCKQYGKQDALIDLAGRGCRGGFGVNELDRFIPGWRDEVEELALLRKRADAAEAALREIGREIIMISGFDAPSDELWIVINRILKLARPS